MNFDILDILFLPALFLIGIVTAYQDFKYGEIKNKWLIGGLVWGALVYFLIAILNLAGYSSIFSSLLNNSLFGNSWPNLITNVLLNSFCSFFFGYLLWHFGLWSAGDAKLFFVFSFLLPLKYYFNNYFSTFPSIILFINVFLCAFLFLLVMSILCSLKILFLKLPKHNIGNSFKSNKTKFKKLLKHLLDESKIHIKAFLNSILMLIVAFLIAKTVTDIFQNNPHFTRFFTIMIILGLVIFGKKIFKFVTKFNKILISLLIIYLFILIIFFPPQLKTTTIFILKIFMLFSAFFGALILLPQFYIKETREINMPFAIWLTLGAVITIFLKGSLFPLFFK